MRLVLGCVFFCLLMFSYSCQKNYAFSQSQLIPEGVWTYQNILKYEFDIPDTESLYDLYLEIDYLTSFPYQNVYVNIFTGQNPMEMKETQLSLDLSNKLGIWKGDCTEERCTYLMPLQKSIFFQKTGKQLLWIEQYSRDEQLRGIQSVKVVGDKIGVRNANTNSEK